MAVIAALGRLNRPFCGLIGSVCLFTCAESTADVTPPPVPPPDRRIAKLETFFRTYGCPEPLHIPDYIRVADKHALDYRLLPAISVRESTCGVHGAKNNYWGWNSARSGFQTVTTGIEFIASRLAEGFAYRNKTLNQKLHVYNPREQYTPEVLALMHEIEDLPALE